MEMFQHNSHPTILIRMLGSFEVLRDGEPVEPAKFGSRKARTLLRWLADGRNEVVPEDVLLEALWPDCAAEDVLRSFRVRVSELRKAITSLAGEDEASHLLERTDTGYRLHVRPGLLETDVDVFLTLAKKALETSSHRQALPLLKHAIDLYRGDYLSDDPYTEQWRSPRQRYHNVFITITGRLADIYEQERRYVDGIRLLQRLLAEPHRDEDLYRKLIRLQYLHGDQAGALRTFEDCRSYLQAEFDAQPMPQTMRLFKQVLRHETLDNGLPANESDGPPRIVHRKPAQTEWPFLGRTRELDLLKQKLSDLEKGQGGIVWLHGSSGVGKNRLLQEALASEAATGSRNLRILQVFGSELNAGIPFAAVLDGLQTGLQPDLTSEQKANLMVSPSTQIQRLLGWAPIESFETGNYDRTPSDPAQDVVLRQEFLSLFERLVQQGPLICHLDHIGALDSTSRALFVALARRVNRWPLLIVVCSPQAPDATDIGADILTASPATTVIPVHPLSVADLRPLIARGTPATATERWFKQLYARTGGDPFMLTEVLDSLKSQDLIDLKDGHVVFPSGLLKLMTDGAAMTTPMEALPARDDGFSRAWREELDENERSLLQKAAMLGDALTLKRLEQLSGQPIHEFQGKLERFLRQGYFTMEAGVGSEGPILAFADHRLRRRVYQTISEAERVWYNSRVFKLLQGEAELLQEPSPVRKAKLFSAVAQHALLAEDWQAAALWSLQAAEAAQRITPGLEVVALCRQAFDAARRAVEDPTLVAVARKKFADALYEIGSYEEALPLYETIAEHDPDDDRINPRLVRMYLHFHRMEDAQALVEQMLQQARDDKTPARGQAMLLLADVYYRKGRLSDAILEGNRAIKHFDASDHTVHRLMAHRRMGLFYWDIGEYGEAIKHTRAAVDAAQPDSIPDMINGLNQLGELYQDIFCTTLAHRTHREALILAQNNGRIALAVEIWRNIGLNFVHEGQLDKGIEILERSWQQAVDLNLEPYRREIHLRALLEAQILAHRPQIVRQLLHKYQREVGPRETSFVAIFTFALALLEGRLDEAEALLEQAQAFWDKTGRRARAAHVLLFAGHELVLHGRPDRAATHLQSALEEMERICRQVPPDIADEVRGSRQHQAAKSLLETVAGRAG